ncbi:unannotated protein [freshwater metagenome]|uniref:Unannotated protein n=1 Tax=freshwater metagenome TaxID=449393 RepID=A0A6J7XUM4_9ZZZZ|nr:CDP-alcohol phosphatidyltransferase family protein [Actinomycetota bacterium]
MISSTLKPAVTRFITPMARTLLRVGLTPDGITILGALGVVLSSLAFFPRGDFFLASFLVTLFALSDLFDGTMARISQSGSSRWGAFLDSTIDRISDSVILVGVCIYLLNSNDRLAVVALITLVTGILIPYIRAKAEAFNIVCSGGAAERTERLAITLSATALHGLGVSFALAVGLWLLAILGIITVTQRMLIVKRAI